MILGEASDSRNPALGTSDSGEMVADNSSDWLPAGWTIQFKVQNGRKLRYYANLKTGQKILSKNDVIRYNKLQSTNSHIKRKSGENHTQLVLKPSELELPAWLPNGWTVELKFRKSGSAFGKPYKCFVDPLTGGRFYSKPAVFRYLKTVKNNSCSPEQKKTGISMQSASKVVFEKHTVEDLPPGWIKEYRLRNNGRGTKRDPYYTDSVKGYVFRSRKDVLRYLETGDIRSCATKPQKRSISNIVSINNEISPSCGAKRQKLKHPTTRRQLFAGKGSSDTNSITLPEVDDSEKGRSKRVSAKNEPASTPAANILQEKDALESSIDKRSNRKIRINPGKNIENRKELNLPSRSSKRLAGVEPELAANMMSSERALWNVGRESFKFEECTETKENSNLSWLEKSGDGKTKINLSTSKKNKLNSPSRSSKRLAGIEPELVANVMSTEQALWIAARNSFKIVECHETKDNSNLCWSELSKAVGPKRNRGKRVSAENDHISIPAVDIHQEKDSLQRGAEKNRDRKTKKNKLNLPHRSSKRLSGLEPELVANVISSERAFFLAARESYRRTENSSLNRSAFRTRGEKISTKGEPNLFPADDIPQDKDFFERNMKNSNSKKTHIDLNNSKKKKEPNFSFQSSELLTELEPAWGANSISSVQSLPVAGRMPCDSEARPDAGSAPDSLADVPSQQLEAGLETVVVHCVSTDIVPCFDEVSLSMSKKPVEDQAAPEELLQKLETEKIDVEKAEPQPIFPFGDSWSDPLEFAYKTLTGLPLEDNLEIQGFFQQQLDNSHILRDGSPLPDFGFHSCFQCDISPQFDSPEKPVSKQQLPVNPSLQPIGNVSFPSCSRNGSEQPCLENNKELHGK